MILKNCWSSIVVLSRALIQECAAANVGSEIEFMDWEAHANTPELPNMDLIGPSAMTVTEHSKELITVSFAIGVSTFTGDKNLFRQRDYVARVFERLRPENKIIYFDAESASEKSVLVITDGTMAAPMSKSESRPWQYVQCEALLVPVGL